MSDLPELGAMGMADRRIRNRILGLPRSVKQALMLGADVLGVAFCVWGAAWLLFPGQLDAGDYALLVRTAVIVAVAFAAYLGFYHSIIRYVGMDLAIAGIKVAVVSGIALGAVARLSGPIVAPNRFAVAYVALCLLYLLGCRYAARFYLNRRHLGRELVIVYGAGEAGARLVLSMQDGDSYLPVALVDDKQVMHGKRVGGLTVYPSDRIEGPALM